MINTYNKAVNNAISANAGYVKVRTTHCTLNGGSLLNISAVKDAVNNFLGVGTKNYDNPKGSAKYLSTAALKDADVTNAKCEKVNGDVYKFTFNLANGSCSAPNGSDSSPLLRCGVLVGAGDRSEYDYKNADNIYAGITGAGAKVNSITGNSTNTVITANINVATGKIQSLNVSWNWSINLNKVSYSLISINGSGTADTSVSISSFSW